jgi:hypothetical protein
LSGDAPGVKEPTLVAKAELICVGAGLGV